MLLKLVVVRVYPFKLWFVIVVDRKGVDDVTIQRLADVITEIGLVHYAYRSDREPALLTLLDQATSLAGRQGRRLSRDEHPEDVAEDLSVYEDLSDIDAAEPDVQKIGAHASPSCLEDIEVRNLTRLPYATWCRWCAMGRRPKALHTRGTTEQDLTTLVCVFATCETRANA